MDSWIEGPGRAFKRPLPGSTNYLSAYDRFGRLIRLPDGKPKNKNSSQSGDVDQVKARQSEGGNPALVPDGLDQAAQENDRQDTTKKDSNALPPESLDDLRPFPLNNSFRSQPVLSEELREVIYDQVVNRDRSVREVSVEYNVSMERVGAVVRLKTIEKDWIEKGKPLAKPYARAILKMVPTTPYLGSRTTHESINDLPVHSATRQQIFYPTSESRAFTRVDAAHVFRSGLLPADKRIPHPQLVEREKLEIAQVPKSEVDEIMNEWVAAEAARKQAIEEREKAEEKRLVKTVRAPRWDFKFRDINVDESGKDGRGQKGVGWRYGFPHQDRKRGQVRIPTSVE
ncbi:hypothetical protein M501DRAFT_994094 [Patellaria atrata CBS 101060]|uniref:Eukaryotic mitochondrial regulator protein-domain-containing protein n=1 Tax=Patellaria atrata CBS 101060 TaxID=1346257 RepID=A0A9P4VTK3_9PEZI|nr:hypothetical protein M501DRAFT_994094 [Patellaria atrata CBS 101060]